MQLDLGPALAVVGALLFHAGGFIWWASKTNTLMQQLVSDVRALKDAEIDVIERLARLEAERIARLTMPPQ